MTTPKTEKKPNSQLAAFRKVARETGADEASEEQFQDALRTIAKAKPQPQDKKRDPR
jgi:hypothetical protein